VKRLLLCLVASSFVFTTACRSRVTEVEPSENFRKAMEEVMQRQPEKYKVKPADLENRKESITLRLSLSDALDLAASHNRTILFSALEVELSRTNTMASKSNLDITAGANLGYRRSESALQTVLPGDTRSADITATTTYGLNANLPFATGTNVALDASFRRVDANSPFSKFEFFPSTKLTVTQHLLHGVGFVPNLSNTWIAEGNERIAELNLAATRNSQAYAVAIAYWDLVESREDFNVLLKQEELANEALSLAQNRADAGLGTKLDVLAQKSNLASLKRSLIQAEYLVEQRTDELLRAIHPDLLTGYSLFTSYKIVIETLTEAKTEIPTGLEPSLINELKGALRKRPEIAVARKGIENAGLAISRDEYGLLPTLDLSGDFTVNGLGATANDSFESYTDFTNLNYGFTLTFGVPIQNRAARASLDASVIRKRQAILDAREAETDVIMEVAAAVRGITSAIRGVEAAQQARDFANDTHKAEVERNKAGLATAFEVKQALNDLTAAERDLVRARIEFEKAKLALLKATGELGQ
jgi:outer membrane protein TolC